MTTLEIILIITCWLLLGIYMSKKQKDCFVEYDTFLATVIVVMAPIWLIGAIIRQVFVENWK